MADFKTELEGGAIPNATVLESGGSLHGTVLEPGASVARGGGLGPGDSFGGYRIVDRLRVTSAEADLYLIEYPGDERRFTLKLYRYGIQPKKEILDRVQSLRREHVVEIHHAGEMNGCQYEIQEFVEHGSLADLLKQERFDDAKTREALKELADALAHLHEIDILHRDIKPSNILVRSKEPTLDLVLTDFGISSITDLSLVLSAVRRTPAYSAPEASTPVLVKKATDWWSVGIILIEMLTGQHPFAGMDDLAISLHLATKPVPIPTSLSPDWQLIIKGLLTRDPRKRWGYEQVTQWLEGKRDMPVFFESEVAHAARPYSYRPYKFAGQDLFDPAELASALAEKWDEAVKRIGRLDILKWVKEDLRDADMANTLQDVADDKGLNEYQRVPVALLVLNRQLPLIWENAVINLDWMQANPKIAAALLDSSVPRWLRMLRNEPWMEALQERRRQILEKLQEVPKINRELAERLILGPPEIVHAEANQIREITFNSQTPAIDQVLRKADLSDAEAILLAACDRSLLWSKEQESARRAEEEQKQKEIEIAERERQLEKEIADQERKRQAAEEEARQGKIRDRRTRFKVANILGWAGLGCVLISCALGPLFLLVYPTWILSGIFIIEYWLREPHREGLGVGHKIALVGSILLIILIIAIIVSPNHKVSF